MRSFRKVVVAVAATAALAAGGTALADPPSVYERQLGYADTYAGVPVHVPVAAPDGMLVRSWERSAASYTKTKCFGERSQPIRCSDLGDVIDAAPDSVAAIVLGRPVKGADADGVESIQARKIVLVGG